MSNIYGIFLAGGSGSRLWPFSRALEPKQLIKLFGNRSILQQSIERILPLIRPDNIYISGNKNFKYEILSQTSLLGIPEKNLFFETESKNTAPAISVVSKIIYKKDPDAKICIFPLDNFIAHKNRFLSIIRFAIDLSENKKIVLLGVRIQEPRTDFGYLKVGPIYDYLDFKKISIKKNLGLVKKVIRFYEKPQKSVINYFLHSENYFWNTGIIIVRVDVIIKEIKDHISGLKIIFDSQEINEDIWHRLEPISIECGVLEKSKNIIMIDASTIGWKDIGSWESLNKILKKDLNNNILNGDVINLNSSNISVFGTSRLIATVGLKDLIIADTDDALLVCDSRKTQEVKNIVEILKERGRIEHSIHKTVKRPWGCYKVIAQGERFKVKTVEIKPHKRLSLQIHKFRSEHWVVVEGQALITTGNKKIILNVNESAFIPRNCVHRLENPSDTILKIIEVQNGDYLEEDDIVRIEDDFQRHNDLSN